MMANEKKTAILTELDRLYPDAGPELHFTNPYETLVAVMLSAQCTDKQVNKVTPAVFERYPDVKSMAAASEDELYQMVKSCGFKSKAGKSIFDYEVNSEGAKAYVALTREVIANNMEEANGQ